MKTQLDRKYVNFILVLCSLAIGLLFVEAFLRIFSNRVAVYQPIWYVPSLNEKYYKRLFLSIYEKGNYDWENFDSRLGWDAKTPETRFRGQSIEKTKKPGVQRILFIGDSYTRGNEVKNDETFPYYVSQMLPEKEILNMGVSGYGLDQTYLKFKYDGCQYDPDIVMVGINYSNYIRASLPFTYFAKPALIVNPETGDCSVINQPVSPPADVYGQLQHEMRFDCYLSTFLRTFWAKLKMNREHDEIEVCNQMDPIVDYILSSFRQYALQHSIQLYLIHIPGGHLFKDAECFKKYSNDRIETSLLKLYQESKIPWINLTDEFLSRYDMDTIYRDFYFHRRNGGMGHLTPIGNRSVANILMEKISLNAIES